jgi:hypothetical protein
MEKIERKSVWMEFLPEQRNRTEKLMIFVDSLTLKRD